MKYADIFGSAVIAAGLSPGRIRCANIAAHQFLIQILFNADCANFFQVGKFFEELEYSIHLVECKIIF